MAHKMVGGLQKLGVLLDLLMDRAQAQQDLLGLPRGLFGPFPGMSPGEDGPQDDPQQGKGTESQSTTFPSSQPCLRQSGDSRKR